MSIFIEQRYFALTTNSPAVIIFPSIVVFHCSVYADDVNTITQNQLVHVSVVFMDPYLPDSTKEAILSLILSRTT